MKSWLTAIGCSFVINGYWFMTISKLFYCSVNQVMKRMSGGGGRPYSVPTHAENIPNYNQASSIYDGKQTWLINCCQTAPCSVHIKNNYNRLSEIFKSVQKWTRQAARDHTHLRVAKLTLLNKTSFFVADLPQLIYHQNC